MTKRLQVILQDPEYRDIQRAARSQRMSLAEWVRRALALARRQQPDGSSTAKLDAIQSAAQHAYPTADIDRMLDEIETGFSVGTPS